MLNSELDKYIVKFKNGDDEAFNTIYDETKKIVYLSIYSIIKSKDVIEDLMQDTYLKAIRALEYYVLGTNFKAWISKIAHNLAINEYNKNKNIDSLDDEMAPEVIDERVDNSLLDSALRILEEEKKEEMKEIFVYRIIFNMKFKDIANILELPKSTVFDIYNRAIKLIKDNI